ncbi:serine/threonine-protein kinase pim-2-like isoform X1 [Cyprinus carpio]|uniref:non-specific serine/threonine protein kinase n=1 Tax=Cyprinus carpio TaxID=7962 RepID=A0A9Q9VHM1_CYPCA|nr:serine/threonine-protein kinase pim-2-like isoform X1 [Cyprinus carpio]
MKLLSRLKKLIEKECVQEPCVLLKHTSNAENHPPHWLDEAPVVGGFDGGEEKKKKKSFWRWPALSFPRKATKYNLAKAENKHQAEAGSYRTFSEAPASKVHPVAAEEQLEQDVLGKCHIRSHYKIGSKLGQGGFGFVYEGTRCKDELKVAVKFSVKSPNTPYIRVPGHPKSIPMEIGLTLMANKIPRAPEIIKILDWEDNEDHFIMVMERPMPCMNLKSFVKLHGESLDEGTARNIMRQVIEAANVCVKRGVFHRDIKMENLLVNQDTMEVKLIDFGCGAQMKRFGYDVFSGTKAYCPPEVTVNGKYHAKPTTVWSLGILLFMMACGYYPTEYDLDLISKRSWTRPGLSQECCQMISSCLQSDPQQRIDLEKMHMHDWFKSALHLVG